MLRKPCTAAPLKRRNLPLLILQAREQVIAHFRPLLNANGITEQQWRIVRLLLETGPLEPNQIGERCRLSSPSLAGVLARMEQMGFVRRKRLPNDQRRVRISLTPRSRALAARMAPSIEAVYAHIEELLGQAFSREFYRMLDDFISKLQPQDQRSALTSV
ncbi:MAG: homoprotocatechuate degradation operon regulator HpaR [Steroidobacteraceae bacterium]